MDMLREKPIEPSVAQSRVIVAHAPTGARRAGGPLARRGYPTAMVGVGRTDGSVVVRVAYDLVPGADEMTCELSSEPVRLWSLEAAEDGERVDEQGMVRIAGGSDAKKTVLVRVPRIVPIVFADSAYRSVAVLVDRGAATFDADEQRLFVTFRGRVDGFLRPSDLVRLVVSLERVDALRSTERILRDLVRGTFSFAWETHDVAAGRMELSREEEARLVLARFETWEGGVEPGLSLEDYATTAARLALATEAKATVLACHELDEHGWLVEERAWLERLAEAAAGGDVSLVVRYGDLFVQAKRDAVNGGAR